MNIDIERERERIPDRYYYQINDNSPMENYFEQKQKIIKTYKERKRKRLKQEQEQKKSEKLLEEAIDRGIEKQLDKVFSKI